ncbi:MAG: hypothetical protein J6M06_04225 [Synergistaceae bacterium]|nr:hypothetical protein [Synergistaceae bacterium]
MAIFLESWRMGRCSLRPGLQMPRFVMPLCCPGMGIVYVEGDGCDSVFTYKSSSLAVKRLKEDCRSFLASFCLNGGADETVLFLLDFRESVLDARRLKCGVQIFIENGRLKSDFDTFPANALLSFPANVILSSDIRLGRQLHA